MPVKLIGCEITSCWKWNERFDQWPLSVMPVIQASESEIDLITF